MGEVELLYQRREAAFKGYDSLAQLVGHVAQGSDSVCSLLAEELLIERVHALYRLVRAKALHAAAPRLVGLVDLLDGHNPLGDKRGLLLQLAPLPRHGGTARANDNLSALAI